MAATVLAAIKEIHNNDETVQEYISQGVFYAVAPDSLDITQGGLLVINHQGMSREKTTESVMEVTDVDLIYYLNSLEDLDQYVVPWAIALFDDSEDAQSSGTLSIDGTNSVSVDIAQDKPIQIGPEATCDKAGNNVFSATIPLRVQVERSRANSQTNTTETTESGQ